MLIREAEDSRQMTAEIVNININMEWLLVLTFIHLQRTL